ncbi:MAG: Na/Pi symporter [Pseudomonadota bacterium]|nr:Na/Pi symporter [Pseudomonadota bacterium]
MSLSHSFLWFGAGLGLFLYGMSQLEEGLGALSSQSFRRFLRRTTANPISSLLGGTVTTMLVQSSSMVGLMMMALVGAGVIPLYNAVGVVLGANLGTTFTGWIVATLGFKLDLTATAVPLMGGGALWLMLLSGRERWQPWGRLVLGLGLLLFGLDAMKTSMEQVSARFDVGALQGYPALVYLLVGVLFSALIQSSSATMMITLSALHAGIIDLHSAAALVIGADLGTTSTLALGGIGATAIKKQLALAHILINVVTAILAFSLLPLLLGIIERSTLQDPLYHLVAFHSGFNLVGILVLIPFVKPFSRFLERRFLAPEEDVRTFIQNVPPTVAGEAVEATGKEVACLLWKVLALALRDWKLDAVGLGLQGDAAERLQRAASHHRHFEQEYDAIKFLEGEILEFCGAVQAGSVTPEQVKELHRYLNAARHGVYAAKSLKDIRQNLAMLRHSEAASLQAYYTEQLDYLKQQLRTVIELLSTQTGPPLRQALLAAREDNRALHQEVEQRLFSQGLHEGADERETSTLLNVNRECRAAVHNLLRALGFLRLEDEALYD